MTFGALALGLPAPATALGAPVTYCVNSIACEMGGGTHAGTLALAIDAAQNNGNAPDVDTIKIGPGTPADGPTTPAGMAGYGAGPFAPVEPVNIQGAGSAITAIGAASGVALTLKGGSSVRDLAIAATGTATGAVQVTGAGATLLQRLRLNGPLALEAVAGADVTIDSSLVQAPASATSCALKATAVAAGALTLLARNVTLVGDGTAGNGAAICADASGTDSSSVTARSSAIFGFALHVTRSATGTGAANVTVPYTTYDSALTSDHGGPGSINPTNSRPAAVAADFTAPGDPVNGFRLPAGSALLNQGDTAALLVGESITDLDGNPRVSGAARDVGAYERPPDPSPPPVTTGGTGSTGTTGSETGPPVGQTDPPEGPPGPPQLVVAQRALRTSGIGRLRVSVGCFGGDPTKFCTGTLKATTTGKYTLARGPTATQPKKPANLPVLKAFAFGSARYKVQVGRSGVVMVRIPLAARKLLVREKQVTIRLTATPAAVKGNVARAARATAVVRVTYAVPQQRSRGR